MLLTELTMRWILDLSGMKDDNQIPQTTDVRIV
jgi:hypothetical protein